MQTFDLVSFPADELPGIEISGGIGRVQNQFTVRYELTGGMEQILIPPVSVSPVRKGGLWKTTCFEFFLALPDRPQYWEFNMSPSGDWNVYKMDRYRRMGFREEKLIGGMQVEARNSADGFTLRAIVDVKSIFEVDQVVEAGVTAVIRSRTGHESYWALAHPGGRADFHLREGFIIRL